MRIIYSCILLLLYSLTAFGQDVKVVAPSEVDVNNYFQLRYVIENADVENIKLPSLKDFTVLSGPNYSESSSMIFNGSKMTQSKTTTYTYILEPKEQGEFTIPAASLIIDGKTIVTKKVKIHVTGEKQQQSGKASRSTIDTQRSIKNISEKDLFVRVITSKTKVLEQEAVLLTYRVYWRIGVGLSNIYLQKTPEFQGFVTKEVPISTLNVSMENVKNETYKCADRLMYVLFPQKSGKLEIAPLTIDCEVIESDPSMDAIDAFFNGRMRSRIFKCTSQAFELEVAPLPQPQPADFIGVVGDITLSGKWASSKMHAKDPAHYLLTVSGKGNLNLMLPPTMTDGDAIEVYDVTPQEDLQLTANGYTGKVVYDYTILPLSAGKTTLPALTASYYNTTKGCYDQLSTSTIPMNVLPSVGGDESKSSNVRSDIHTINPGEHETRTLDEFVTWGTMRYLLTYVLLLVGGIFIYYGCKRYQNRDREAKVQRGAIRKAMRQLKLAEQSILVNDAATFHAKVLEALTDYLTEKFKLTRAEVNRQHIQVLLTSRKVDADAVLKLLRIIEACEYAKFAPASDAGSLKEILNDTTNVIHLIDNSSN